MTRFTIATLTLFTLTAAAAACDQCAAGGPPPEKPADEPSAKAERQKQHEKTARKVWKDLLDNADPLPNLAWPPVFRVEDSVMTKYGPDKYNAVAHLLRDEETNEAVKRDGKFVPVVTITRGYLEQLDGDENAIALVLGHELGHHALGHTLRFSAVKPGALAAMENHRREADADLFGARLMLKAGYSLRKAARFSWQGTERNGILYSAAMGTCVSHPATSDRLARLFAILDKNEAELWRSMSAFENGVTFLAVEDFLAAEESFARVTREFPQCHEAWANLGLARLMRYCDSLSADDLRKLGVGHFLGSTYYRTAKSLMMNRGDRTELWHQAVTALKKARDLKPSSPLVLANLGLAYLIHPAGKGQGIGDATEYLEQATEALGQNTELPAHIRAGLLVNLGVARLAEGDAAKGRQLLDAADTIARGLPTGSRAAFTQALQFNRALALAGTNQKQAAALFEGYLTTAPRSSPWWPVAYERYAALCESLGTEATPKAQLGKDAPRRRQLAVALPAGGVVHVGEALDDVVKRLGEPDRETRIDGTTVRRLHFDAHGIYLVADKEEVFAVVIVSADGPRVVVREGGLGGKRLGEIRVGMTRKDVESLPGGAAVTQRPFVTQDKDGKFYHVFAYYADLGVAIVYDKDNVVIGILVGELKGYTEG